MINFLSTIFNTSDIFNEFPFQIKIIRIRKNSISLIIRNGILYIRSPNILSERQIYLVIKKKEDWIKKKIDIQKERIENLNKESLRKDIFLYEGMEKKIDKINSKIYSTQIIKNKLIFSGPDLSDPNVEKRLQAWFRKVALEKIEKKSNFFAKKMKLSFRKVGVKNYKSKWGLCMNLRKEIYINWRLVMAPKSVLNYVIIHELCHLIEPNHSKKFWYYVEKIKPDYKMDEKWLKNKGYFLFAKL